MAELMNFLTEFINTMGFPIAMVVYFIWDKEKTMKPLIEAMNNNNIVMQENATMLGMILDKLNVCLPSKESE